MSKKPILFSGPMVRAILREIECPGTGKIQTRRMLKPQPIGTPWFWAGDEVDPDPMWFDGYETGREPPEGTDHEVNEPMRLRYAPGDRLWVRETWTARMTHGWTIADARSRMYQEEILYRADVSENIDGWWPSIHMPREFSRITLIVTDVRVERLGDISAKDSIAEGVECETCKAMGQSACQHIGCFASIAAFRDLWDNLNGSRSGCSWADNPWVCAISFRPILGNIDTIEAADVEAA